MREKDIHNLIEQQNPEEKREMWEKIRSQLNLDDVQPAQAVAAKPKKWKWATAIALAVAVVVTLSIVLPITLKDDGVRYCDSTKYETAELGQTLAEYSASHNRDFLYVDWYDVAYLVITSYGYNKDDKNDIYYYSEQIISDEIITVSITDNKTRVDIFDRFLSGNDEFVVHNITVKYCLPSFDSTIAMFEYQNNIYYLEIEEGNAQDRLAEIITDMLK